MEIFEAIVEGFFKGVTSYFTEKSLSRKEKAIQRRLKQKDGHKEE